MGELTNTTKPDRQENKICLSDRQTRQPPYRGVGLSCRPLRAERKGIGEMGFIKAAGGLKD